MAVDLSNSSPLESHPLRALPREDLDLIVELVLRSGSLKELATVYGVSYPTIRLRLDRVIERLQAAVEGKKQDPLSDLLATLVERGEMSVSAARVVRDAARKHLHGSPIVASSSTPIADASERGGIPPFISSQGVVS
jgi:hypothetical protein